MRMRFLRRALAATFLAASAATFSASALAADVPKTITHQGRLYDASDKPINGSLSVQFAIYADTGDAVAIWSEVDTITFDDGYFSVSIGETTPFGANVFDGRACRCRACRTRWWRVTRSATFTRTACRSRAWGP